MSEEQGQITALIVENRQMIATILADLLEDAGYSPQVLGTFTQAIEILPQQLPAAILVDHGMIRAEQVKEWESLEETARLLEIPLLSFSCSPLADRDDLLILRSPADFARAVEMLGREVEKTKPLVGMALVRAGFVSFEEVEGVLQIQRQLAALGRRYSLGDLFVQLGFVGREALERALKDEEL